MSFLGDLASASVQWHKDMRKEVQKNPWRLVTGLDPWNTKISNAILGRDDIPIGDYLGGPSEDVLDSGQYSKSQRKAARYGKNVAAMIGAYYFLPMLGGAQAGNWGQLFGGGGGGGGGGEAGKSLTNIDKSGMGFKNNLGGGGFNYFDLARRMPKNMNMFGGGGGDDRLRLLQLMIEMEEQQARNMQSPYERMKGGAYGNRSFM